MIKFNAIYGKIIVFLITTGIIFLILFLILIFYKSKFEKQIISTSQEQFNHEVNSLLELNTESSLQTLDDNVYWDELVQAIEKKDTSWIISNMTMVKTFFYDYYCIYNYKYEIVRQEFNCKLHLELTIPKEAIVKLNHSRYSHFFMVTSEGLMEVYASSVHPTDDYEPKLTDPSGYMFLVKKWDQEYLIKMATISGKKIDILKMNDPVADNSENYINAKINLAGWNGMPVSMIVFSRIINFNFDATQNIMY